MPRRPPQDTPEHELQQRMMSQRVRWLFLECLRTGNSVADPAKRELGKKKNHWVIRLVIANSFDYYKDGLEKHCESVRVSIETPPNSLRCREIQVKPMANSMEPSRSSFADFRFPIQREGVTVRSIVDAAIPMLPFEYKVVAITYVDTAGSSRRRGQNQERINHLNGCRDFTAQWFTRLYLDGIVNWEADLSVPSYVTESLAFDRFIGIRYSPGVNFENRIAMATFPRSFQRVRTVLVENVPVELPYELEERGQPPTYRERRE